MAAKNSKKGAFETPNWQLSLAYFGGERVTEIPLDELHEPDPHPFLVQDDDAMAKLAESVKQYGVREPGLARLRAEGGYELLCGNRRKRACEIVGLTAMPVIVRELSDDDAAIALVDSNLQQRECILPSEKAWAYKIKMDALNHKGVKGDAHSADAIAAQAGDSRNQVFRFIRLTELIEVLLDKVDTRGLSFNAAVELSYLSYDEQREISDAMDRHEVKPSLSQAVRIKKLKQAGKLTVEVIDGILAEEKKPPQGKPTGAMKFRKFFPPEYSPKQIESVIFGLLKNWKEAAL